MDDEFASTFSIIIKLCFAWKKIKGGCAPGIVGLGKLSLADLSLHLRCHHAAGSTRSPDFLLHHGDVAIQPNIKKSPFLAKG